MSEGKMQSSLFADFDAADRELRELSENAAKGE